MVLMLIGRFVGLLSRAMPRLAARLAWSLSRLTARPRQQPPFGREIARHRSADGEVVLHALATPQSGPRVLMVHGWNGAAQDWKPLARQLAARGFDVFAADLPGHGASQGRSGSLPRFVRGLQTIAREHGPFDIWIGHSMGANAALAAVARGAGARRLVLIGALVRPGSALRGFARAFGLSAPSTESYLAEIERREAMAIDEVEAERNAPRVLVPTLLVHDVDDRVIPLEHGEALAARLPQARLLRTRGLGHRRLLGDPEVGRQVAEFVAAS